MFRKRHLQGAAKGVRQKEFDHFFFVFGTLSVTFRSLFLTLLSLFSSLFCRTPFAGLLLWQGDTLFTKCLFMIFVPLYPPPPNQHNDGFTLEFRLKGPQTELRTLSKNCEQTLQKMRTNRITNKRAFMNVA